MGFHVVTEPIIDFLYPNKDNLLLEYFPNLLSTTDQFSSISFVRLQRESIEQKLAARSEVETAKRRLSPILADAMRRVHGVQFSNDYWDILLGPWMHTAISNLYLRLENFHLSLQVGPITSMCLISSARNNHVALDTSEYFRLIQNIEWKNARDWRISKHLGLNLSAIKRQLPSNSLSPMLIGKSERSISQLLKSRLQKATTLFNGYNPGLFLETYMPRLTEFKVNLLLRQFPSANRPINWQQTLHFSNSHRPEIRDKFLADIGTAEIDENDKFLLTELAEQIPSVFLEHYAEVRLKSKMIYPKNVSFVFTSNSFHQDELFKFWIAEKKLSGTKYLVGQHGNNYGANTLITPTNEELTCDCFFTWGWKVPEDKYLPSVVLKTAGLKLTLKHDGGLLLLSTAVPNGHSAWDETIEYFDQLQQQHAFVDRLDESIKPSTTIRIPALNSLIGDVMPNAWNKDPVPYRLDLGLAPYSKVRTQYRLTVFSYDSTGLLEGLASNVPSMAFWLDGLDHLNDFARAKYQILVDAGIVFLDSTDCATMVNEVWDDVDGWWKSKEIQEAREKFCANFCEYSDKPARDIAKAIRRAIAS
jgi:putative transferase (TIGR04331 family)